MNKVQIELRNWDNSCDDGCCYDYGTEIYLDGELIGGKHTGECVRESLERVLSKLGYKPVIEETSSLFI